MCFAGFFFWSLAFSYLTVMCLGGVLCVYSTCSSLSFLNLQVNTFHQIWETCSYYFFKFFSARFSFPLLFLKLHCTYVGRFDIVSWVTEAVLLFFHLFSFCSSNTISIDPSASSPIFSFDISNVLLSHLVIFFFFHFSFVLLTFRISFWFFFSFHFSFEIFHG